ncbi:MAG TPA: zf-HC2 domain-containing protein [Candidatus Binatia bacterium]|jgi:hypothetical protein
MNCPEVQELFSDYLDARLAPSHASLLKEHLGFCSACRQELEALRSTVTLICSLGEIKTAPDFLIQVNRKIDSGWKLGHLWRWAFVPAKIKLPVEAAALLIVTTLAFYVYRSSELSQESAILFKKSPKTSEEEKRRMAELDPSRPNQNPRSVLAYKELNREATRQSLSEALSEKETPAPPSVAQAPREKRRRRLRFSPRPRAKIGSPRRRSRLWR